MPGKTFQQAKELAGELVKLVHDRRTNRTLVYWVKEESTKHYMLSILRSLLTRADLDVEKYLGRLRIEVYKLEGGS